MCTRSMEHEKNKKKPAEEMIIGEKQKATFMDTGRHGPSDKNRIMQWIWNI